MHPPMKLQMLTHEQESQTNSDQYHASEKLTLDASLSPGAQQYHRQRQNRTLFYNYVCHLYSSWMHLHS